MAQNYPNIPDTKNVSDSRVDILSRDDAVKSCFAGTTFPAVVLADIGMLCYRTDLDVLYELISIGPDNWVVVNNPMLRALAALASNGIVVRTGSGQVAIRAITAPAAGITITNGDGVAGDPTLGLANDLAALEALNSTGYAQRTAADTWTLRTAAQLASDLAIAGQVHIEATSASATTITPAQMGAVIAADASGGSVVINLPNIWSAPQSCLVIMRVATSLNATITINNSGQGDVFSDGVSNWSKTSLVLNGQIGESVILMPAIIGGIKMWLVVSRKSLPLFWKTVSASSGVTLTNRDSGICQECSGTFNVLMPQSTATDPWFAIPVRNSGTGTISLVPQGSDTVEGKTSYDLNSGEGAIIYLNGTDWRAFKTGGAGGGGSNLATLANGFL